MRIYPPAAQKSSDPSKSSLNPHYGLSRSVAIQAVIKGMTPHLRIYEAALRLGMENMLFEAKDLIAWLGEHDIEISMATAQRALVDTAFFRLVTHHKTGKRGRPAKIYTLVKPHKIGERFGIHLGASWGAPELAAVDLSSTLRYKLALLGRAMTFMDSSTRQQQVKFWEWSKPTLIRWTREVCDISMV